MIFNKFTKFTEFYSYHHNLVLEHPCYLSKTLHVYLQLIPIPITNPCLSRFADSRHLCHWNHGICGLFHLAVFIEYNLFEE